MLNPFMIAGLIMVGVGLLQVASDDDEGPKLLAGPAGKTGKTGAAGAAGKAGKEGKEGKQGKDATVIEPASDG